MNFNSNHLWKYLLVTALNATRACWLLRVASTAVWNFQIQVVTIQSFIQSRSDMAFFWHFNEVQKLCYSRERETMHRFIFERTSYPGLYCRRNRRAGTVCPTHHWWSPYLRQRWPAANRWVESIRFQVHVAAQCTNFRARERRVAIFLRNGRRKIWRKGKRMREWTRNARKCTVRDS